MRSRQPFIHFHMLCTLEIADTALSVFCPCGSSREDLQVPDTQLGGKRQDSFALQALSAYTSETLQDQVGLAYKRSSTSFFSKGEGRASLHKPHPPHKADYCSFPLLNRIHGSCSDTSFFFFFLVCMYFFSDAS